MDMQAIWEMAGRIGEVATGLESVASSVEKLPGARQLALHDLSIIAAGFAQQGEPPETAAQKALDTYRTLLTEGHEEGSRLAEIARKAAS